MAKRVKKEDLRNLLTSSLNTALEGYRTDHPMFRIDINSISATIKIDEPVVIASKFFSTDRYDGSPLQIFKEYLKNHTGENLIPTTVKEENSIIIQVNYDIIE